MIKNKAVGNVVGIAILIALGICMVTHPMYTLGGCALVVGIANMVKLVRST